MNAALREVSPGRGGPFPGARRSAAEVKRERDEARDELKCIICYDTERQVRTGCGGWEHLAVVADRSCSRVLFSD